MIITKLDKVGTKQVRLFFDEEKYCLLYYNEIRRLGFHEQDEIGQKEFEEWKAQRAKEAEQHKSV